VAVLFAEVGDVRSGGLEDPKAQYPEMGKGTPADVLNRFISSHTD
jgi:hypothetical protein